MVKIGLHVLNGITRWYPYACMFVVMSGHYRVRGEHSDCSIPYLYHPLVLVIHETFSLVGKFVIEWFYI